METGKLSKVARLTAALEAAKAALAAKEPALLAALAKANDEVKRLRKAADLADANARQCYVAHTTACREEAIKLGLTTKTGEPSEKLLASMKTFAVSVGCPTANLVFLTGGVITRELAKIERLAALDAAYKAASKQKDKTYGAWNVAQSPGAPVNRLHDELRKLREQVSDLEDEIKKTPERNKLARERRIEARQEEIADQDTVKLRALLATFSFVSEPEQGS